MSTRREIAASRDKGKPRYFYHFFRKTEDWTYTNFQRKQTYAGDVYLPLEIDHGEIERGSEDNPGAVPVTLPSDSPIGIVLKEGSAPTPISLRIAVMEKDVVSEPAIIFNGEIRGADFEGDICTVHAVPLQSRLNRNMPRGSWSRDQCVWQTFARGCDLAPGPFTHAGTVTSISTNGLLVTVSGTAAFSGTDPAYFALGVLTKGERKGMIEEQSGDVIRLQHVVPTLTVGDAVSLLAGDDRKKETCKIKFNNIERYMAFYKIPILNPHYGQGLRP